MTSLVRDYPRQGLYELLQVALVTRVPREAAKIPSDALDVLERLCQRQHRFSERLNILLCQYLQESTAILGNPFLKLGNLKTDSTSVTPECMYTATKLRHHIESADSSFMTFS